MVLEPGKVYTIEFRKEGYFQKLIQIDASDCPTTEQESSFKLFTDVLLFEEVKIEDASTITKSPMAKCAFNSNKNRMDWDINHAKIAFDNFLRVTGLEDEFAQKE